jgi:hypothetical protein
MAQLVLTRKPVLNDMARWLDDDAQSTVVVTTSGPVLDVESSFLHVQRVADYSAAEVGAQVVELARRFGVARIASLNEVDVVRAAAARQLVGLPGQDPASAVAFRDKYMMKSLAAAHGVPVAPMRRAPDVHAAERAGRDLRYPLVVKPVAGGGSVCVHVLVGPDDWTGVSAQGPLLVEEMVDEVAFYIIDGLMCDGRVTLHVPLQMGSGNVTYATGGQPVAGYSLPLDGSLFGELTEFCNHVLGILPPVAEETAFHMEIFRDRQGRLVLCEVASRAGGMGHAPTFSAVTGVDLNEASLRGQLGYRRRAAAHRRLREGGFAGFPRRDGTLLRHPDHLSHPRVTSYVSLAEVGRPLSRSRWVGDDAAKILAQAPVGAAMDEVMDEVIAEYHALTEWV